jgi:hypothetical protein
VGFNSEISFKCFDNGKCVVLESKSEEFPEEGKN